MLHTLTSQVGLIVLVLVCLLALARGGPPERIGALLVAASWVGLLVWQSLTQQIIPEIPLLVSDVVLATGFLVLAVRYASLWLGAGMLFQAAAFAVHLFHMTQTSRTLIDDWIYVLTVNGLSYAVLAALAGATAVTWRRRQLAERRAQVSLPPAPVSGP